MRVPPSAQTLTRIPSWEWLQASIDGKRSAAVVRSAQVAGRLEATIGMPHAEAERRLTAVPGVGTWTAAEVRQRAHGDPDAVSFGDYHVAKNITWALTGQVQDDDALLEPARAVRRAPLPGAAAARAWPASGVRAVGRGWPRAPICRVRADCPVSPGSRSWGARPCTFRACASSTTPSRAGSTTTPWRSTNSLRDVPGSHHTWLLDPAHAAGFPDDVRTVEVHSAEASAALGAADVVISNHHVEVPWPKRPDCLYLQTWHGTPLKHVHADIPHQSPRIARMVATFDLDVALWDVLTSPSEQAGEWLARAFRFDGESLATGSPRNDVLVGPDAGAVRAAARAGLGLEDHQTAVLYAPTWRDDQMDATGAFDFDLRLDLDAFRRRLGPDHVLLVRLHPFVSGRLRGRVPDDDPRVRDVSFVPQVSDLYLAADALVTDYSSVMFDFAVTGKPLVFYTYDFEHYRDDLRGFTFDPRPVAPGPMVRSSDEVLDALADLDAVRERWRAPYAAFRERFCSTEDGRAAERVADRARAGVLTREAHLTHRAEMRVAVHVGCAA
nr:CDP-glycerol glycerophosphotransferase family protein [Angustibacter aerolatus]